MNDTLTITSTINQYSNIKLLAICSSTLKIKDISGTSSRILEQFNLIEGNKIIFDNFLLMLDEGVFKLMEDLQY